MIKNIAKKILIIGGNSDLIKPFFTNLNNDLIETLCFERKDWDLKNPIPPDYILKEICTFNPNQLIYAAGINVPNDLTLETKEIINEIVSHFNVNCLSFISLVLFLKNELQINLEAIHVISSLYGIYGKKTRLPYSVSKHGLEGAIKCLALELKNTQIIGYRPGFFQTKMTDKNMSNNQKNNLIKRIPKGRLGKPEELSKILLSNILNNNYYLNGTCINIDGGISCGGFFEL